MLIFIIIICILGTVWNLVYIMYNGIMVIFNPQNAILLNTMALSGIRTMIYILLGFGNIMLCTFLERRSPVEVKETKRYELVPIRDNSEHYIHVHEDIPDIIYSFRYKSNNEYKYEMLSSENTIIYQEEICEPVVIEYTTKNMLGRITKLLTMGAMVPPTKKYEMYVNIGTIVSGN